nr:putative methylase [Klebsiella pneumoniae]
MTDEWLQPATLEMYRVLKRRPDGELLQLEPCGPLYGRVEGGRILCRGPACVHQNYASNRRNARARRGFVDYCHEGLMSLPKAARAAPKPLPDVLPFPYTGNTLHPTQKPVEALQPLIESFSTLARLFSTRLRGVPRPASPHTAPDAAISALKCWRSTTGPEPNDWPCAGP